jgi:PAS domain S-box-containing protein
MHELAVQIRSNVDALAKEYDLRLRGLPGYAELPPVVRVEEARDALLVVAAGLQSGDQNLFVQFVQTMATERMAQGFEIESVREALTLLAEIIEPQVSSAQEASLLWRTMVRVQVALSQVAIDRLRTAEEQFRYLADNLAVGIFIHHNGVLRYAGREGARMLGYDTPDELLGRSVFDFVHPADRARVASIAQRRVAGEPVPGQYEARLLRKDGRVIDVQLYSQLTEYDGQVSTQGIFVDITERKRQERRIRQTTEALQILIDSMPFGVIITGRDKRIRHANPAAVASMGYETEAEVRGRICHETMCPAEADTCPILDLGLELDQSERVLVTKDGHHIPILKSAVPVSLGGDEVLLEAFIDFTRQKQLEQEIQESLDRRGRQVQTSTEIAQEIASAPALDELYHKVVHLVRERFGYYHAQLFLLNEEGDRLVTVAGYGQVGEQFLQQGYSIALGKGVVGRAALEGMPVLSIDVSEDPEWLFHPLLPETRAELAVPIIHRRVQEREGTKPLGQVVGVLDVQSDKAGVLTDEDRILLEGLCGQIAIAIESTRLRQETEEYLRELERLTRAMSHEGWQTYRQKTGPTGHLFNRRDVLPAVDLWFPEIEEAARSEALVPPRSETRPVTVAPLRVHDGELIGVLGVEDDLENPLSQEELQLVESVSQQVAQALESARLFEESQQRVQEISMLFDVSQALSSAPLEAEEIADLVARRFVEAMGVPEASLSLLDPKQGELTVVADVYADPEEGAKRRLGHKEVFRQAEYPATARVIETLRPLVVQSSDPEADPAELAYMRAHGVATLAIIPLAVKGQALGIVELETWGAERRFTPEELNLAMTLATQAAVALENVRLLKSTQDALEEVRNTHRAYLQQAWQEHLRQRGVLSRSAFLYDQYSAKGPDDTKVEPDLWLPEMERAIVEGQPAVVRSADGEPERAGLAVPIILRGQTLGVIGVEAPEGNRQWTDEEIVLVQAVGEQLGQALESARLFEDTRRRAERERLIGEITAKIRSSTDVQAILQTAAAELGQVLGVSRARVQLAAPGSIVEGQEAPVQAAETPSDGA